MQEAWPQLDGWTSLRVGEHGMLGAGGTIREEVRERKKIPQLVGAK